MLWYGCLELLASQNQRTFAWNDIPGEWVMSIKYVALGTGSQEIYL